MKNISFINISYSDCFGIKIEILGIAIEKKRFFYGSLFKLVISSNYIGLDLFFKRILTWIR